MKKRPVCQMAAAFVVGLLIEYTVLQKSQLINLFPGNLISGIPLEVFCWLFLCMGLLIVWGIGIFCKRIKIKKKKIITQGIILGVCFLAGTTIMKDASRSYLPEHVEDGSPITVTGHIYKYEIKDYQIYYYLKTEAVYHDVLVMVNKGKLSNQQDVVSPLFIGMTVEATGFLFRFSSPTNPGQFNQTLYYKSQNVDFAIKKASIIIINNKSNLLMNGLQKLKKKLSDEVQNIAGKKYGGVLAAMLYGDAASMDMETKKLYQRLGISHIMSISGLHVSILGLGLYKLLCKCKCPNWLSAVIGGVSVVLFGMLTGMAVSTARAAVMYMLAMIARILGRTYDMPTAVSLAAVWVLAERPYALFQSSMQFSFGAIFALILYYKLKNKGPGKTLDKTMSVKHNKVKNWGKLDGFFVSAHIQISLLPLQLYHTYIFSMYSSLLNLFIIPTMSILLYLGITATMCAVLGASFGAALNSMVWLSIFGGMLQWLSEFLIFPCKVVLWLYEIMCHIVEKLPLSVWVFGRPQWWQIAVYYLLFVVFCFCLTKVRSKIVILCLLIPISMVLILRPIKSTDLKITMLDVGQGECICMELPDGKVILSDGGSTDIDKIGTYRIKPFLMAKGIAQVDGVFISHWDQDHISGIRELLTEEPREIKIKTIVLPKTAESISGADIEQLLEFIEEAEEAGVHVQYVSQGDVCQFGDVTFTCLWPKEPFTSDDINEYSTVYQVSYGEFDMLLTGDLPKKFDEAIVEAIGFASETQNVQNGDSKLVDTEFDVLKVAHHGSKYSTSEELLRQLRPAVALISSGQDNSYGHPHEEVLSGLQEVDTKVYRTDEDGTIEVRVRRDKVKVSVHGGR